MTPRHRVHGGGRTGPQPQPGIRPQGRKGAEGAPGQGGISRPAGGSEPGAGSEPGGGSRVRRRLPRLRTIRARLALIVAVPTLLLTVLAGVGVAQQVRTTREADAVTDNVELVLATQDLINSLQRERALTSGFLGGAAQYRPQMDAQRRASDQNRAALDRLAAGSGRAGGRAVRAALQRLSALESLRGSIDRARLDRTTVLDFYTTAIVALGNAADDGTLGRGDERLRGSLESLRAIGDAKEAVALERGQLNGVFAQDRFTGDDYRRFTETRAAKVDAMARFRQLASPRRAADLDAAMRTPQAELAHSFEDRALTGAAGGRLGQNAARWSAVMTTVGYDLREIQRGIGDDIRTRARQMERTAEWMLGVYSLAALAMVVIALLLWLYTFRAIVRPLRMLTDEAHEAAERRLPGAVARVQSAENPDDIVLESSHTGLTRREDEFAEVATALENLQGAAVRLAVEQAVMRHNTAESLANLGRRNQNLVRRQLGFISALEREEADPNALANLFELDHLATRMRRNAESLLVLVGEHSPRRWSGAVAVGDVMRSAFAEVEDYRRVILRRADHAKVQGAAAAEISHLLAELVDNALSFSPPDQEVEVQARATGNEYHIAIVDQGVGMTPEAMAVANARLSGTENFLVSPTRDLGHYVVGRLARRLGIRVWLHDSPLNGVTARVVLPATLLVLPERGAARQAPAMAGASAPQGGAGSGGRPPRSAGTGPLTTTGPLGAGPLSGSSSMSTTGPLPLGAATAVAFAESPLPPPPHADHGGRTAGAGSADGAPAGGGPAAGGSSGWFGERDHEREYQHEHEHGYEQGHGYGHPAGAGDRPRPPAEQGQPTTRNGLVKRTPQDRTLRRPIRPVVPQAPAPEPKTRTPGDVRSMLNSFRSGVQRGEQQGERRSGEPGDGEPGAGERPRPSN